MFNKIKLIFWALIFMLAFNSVCFAYGENMVANTSKEDSDTLRGIVNPICFLDRHLVSDGEYLYFIQTTDNLFASPSRIFKAPLSGGEPVCIFDGGNIHGMIYHDGWLYIYGNNDYGFGQYLNKISTDGTTILEILPKNPSKEWAAGTEFLEFSLMDVTNQSIYLYLSRQIVKANEDSTGVYSDVIEESYFSMDLDGNNLKKLGLDSDKFHQYDNVIFLDGWVYACDYSNIIRVRTDGTDLEVICKNYTDPFVTDGEYIYIGKDRDTNGPLDKIKIGETEKERISEYGVDGYYMWYLNGYVNNINVITGETKEIFTLYAGSDGHSFYYLPGWEYYDNSLKRIWILKDKTNDVEYNLDTEGNISVE